MGKLPGGILGAVIGTVGPVTGYRRNGEYLIRTRHSRKHTKITPARLAQQQKIKVCNEFTAGFSGSGFFNKSFPACGDKGTGYNRATSAIMNLAIMGAYPNISLHYPQVLISKGPLPGAINATARAEAGHIIFTWDDNTCMGTAHSYDRVIMVAFLPQAKTAFFTFGDENRSDCKAILTVPSINGQKVHTWLGFISHDEKNTATSVYTGELEMVS